MAWRLARLGRLEEERAGLPASVVLKRLAPLLRPHVLPISAALAATAARTALNLVMPVLIGGLVDSAVQGDLGGLARGSQLFLLAALAYWVVGYLRVYLMSLAGQGLVKDLRARLLNKLLRVRLSVLRSEETGRLVSRVMNDVDVIGEMFTGGLIDTAVDSAAMVVAFAVMLAISPRLTMVVVPLLPAVFLVNYVLAVKARETFRRARRAIARVTARIEQEVSGAAVVKTYLARRGLDEAEFRRVSKEYASSNVEATKVVSSVDPIMSVARAAGVAAILYVGGALLSAGEVTIGTIVAFYGYLELFFRPLQTLAIFFNSIQSALAAAERVTEVLGAEEERSGTVRRPVRGVVEFKNVRFGYDERPVIMGVSLVARPGEVVAIVGPTGSGKSTLARLLLRFYDPWSGEITLDGVRVEEYDLDYLRSVVAYVPQEPAVLSGTVLGNITMGRRVSRREVEALARALHLEGVIATLPKGLDTEVLEEGRNLSKGQRQVVSLLRALVARPRVLVLDEATNNLDLETEVKLYGALKEMARRERMTVIVIAHRLAAVRNADRIYVLEGGRVVEEGRHEELLAMGGLYSRLWRSQHPDTALLEGSPRYRH